MHKNSAEMQRCLNHRKWEVGLRACAAFATVAFAACGVSAQAATEGVRANKKVKINISPKSRTMGQRR